jgi:hypothetical protein
MVIAVSPRRIQKAGKKFDALVLFCLKNESLQSLQIPTDNTYAIAIRHM